MAIVTVKHWVDDFDGSTVEDDLIEHRPFSYRGQDYGELDLSPENAAKFDKDMARWIEAAEKAGKGLAGSASATKTASPNKRSPKKRQARAAATRRTSRKAKKASAADLTPAHRKEIRDWANANGYTVSSRGRLSEEVITAFNEAHP
ncbi:Lsr2 family protein [Mycolicibacterium sp.]|uniref:Lsr2 family protein n=1 Tax=Mycolicibacterium sp. TaxID=2320850 RepID=UPI0037CA7C7E